MERKQRSFCGRAIGKSCRLATMLAFVVAALTMVGGSAARAFDAKSFGWNARPAAGKRPLLAIWVRPPDETPATELARRKQYYEDLIFGLPRHANSYPDRFRELE